MNCNNLQPPCQDLPKMGKIYKGTNLINGKLYVGQTRQKLEDRIRQHKNSKITDGFDGAIKKYGIENFNFEIIEECPVEMLNEREIYWIKEFNSKVPNGYNLTDGGGGNLNCAQSTRDKISANHADVSGINNPNYGKHHSQLTRDKISATKQGSKNPNYGKPRTDKAKENISKALTGKPFSKEHCANISAAKKGKPLSPKQKAALSAARTGKPLSKKHRKSISAALTGRTFSKEHCDNISKAKKEWWAKKKSEKALENEKNLENKNE